MTADANHFVISGDVAAALGCENTDRAFLAAVEKLKVELAQARRQVTDLQEANGRYLQRARDAEARVAQPPEPLWSVHVRGPDDVQAVASYTDAVLMSDGLNWWWQGHPLGDGEPAISVIPMLWEGTPDQHAANLGRLGTKGWDYALPTAEQVDAAREKAMAVRALAVSPKRLGRDTPPSSEAR